MFPNIARLKGYTYASSIFCNIGVIFKDTIENTILIKNFEKVNIGPMPIMVKSKLCILNGMDTIRLTEVGECPYDQGGYFIINGKEKVFLSQEKKINNILYINSLSNETMTGIPLESTLKSVSNEGFQSSRTNYIRLNRVKLNYKPSNTDVAEHNSKYVYRITIRILGIGSPKDMKIPLFILFRALGRVSDKDIIQSIIYDSDSPGLKQKLYELLEPSIKDSQMVYTQKEAYKLLMMHTKGKETLNVIELLKNNFLPNYDTNEEKTYFLGYAVRKLLLTRCKVINETDRDSYSFKRIDLAGSLLLELYRELWGSFQRSVSLKIDWEYKFNFKQYMNDITNIINELNT